MRTQFILATVLLFACRVFGEDTTLAAEQAETEATIVAVEVTSEDVTEVPIEDVQEVTSQPPLPAPEMPRQPMMMYPPQPNPAPSIHFHPAQTHMMRTHIYPRHQFSVFPFNPSMVRRQGPNFIPLPPQNQPVFDPAISCENQEKESQAKRELGKRSLHFKYLDSFFMNPKGHDILFVVCGKLLPAHSVILESISPEFYSAANQLKNSSAEDGKLIESSADLIDSTEGIDSAECTDSSGPLIDAFQLFLKYFYSGNVAFDEVSELDTAFVLWSLGNRFLERETLHEYIEPSIVNLISLDNVNKVYRFIYTTQNDRLKAKLIEFLQKNKPQLEELSSLPLTCKDIGGDVDYLDSFLNVLGLNQSKTIEHIRFYLNQCEQLSNVTMEESSPFPHSLLFYRCSVPDLKELVQMGFITYQHLAEELENRLQVKERYCEEKCSRKLPQLPTGLYLPQQLSRGA